MLKAAPPLPHFQPRISAEKGAPVSTAPTPIPELPVPLITVSCPAHLATDTPSHGDAKLWTDGTSGADLVQTPAQARSRRTSCPGSGQCLLSMSKDGDSTTRATCACTQSPPP